MSAITIGGDLVHYEKLGRGRPVILVHGWIGSWRYWIPLMQKLHLKYSVYTLDLIGFGDSSKNETHYDLNSQVRMLEEFMDKLGLPKAALIGHGLGAMVVTRLAQRNPDKVARMMLASLPLFAPGDLAVRTPAGTRRLLTPGNTRYSLAPSIEEVTGGKITESTVVTTIPSVGIDKTLPSPSQMPAPSPTLEDKTIASGYSFNESPTVRRPENIDREALRKAAEERDKLHQKPNQLLDTFKETTTLTLLDKCFKKNEPEYDKLKVDVDKSDTKVLVKSAEGFEAGAMLDELRQITAPVVAVHGQNDPVMTVPDEEIWNYLTVEKEEMFVPIPLPNVRHFPMLEHDAFSRLTSDFLEASDISKLEIRERWRRRSR